MQPNTPIGPEQGYSNRLEANVRVLEERTSILQKKTELIENNLLKNAKELRSEIKVMQSEITELSRGIADIKEKLKQLINELGNYAKKGDVDVLKKYLDYWEPLNFVTRKEAESLIREGMKKK